MDFSGTLNVNDMYNVFHDKFLSVINKYVSMKTLSNRELKLMSKPWG